MGTKTIKQLTGYDDRERRTRSGQSPEISTKHYWSQIGLPHKGWRCVGVYDLKDDADEHGDYEHGTCEACGKEQIRFVHTLRHPEYARDIEVGCVCAERLEDDYFGPKERERKAANRAGRRAKWLTRKWKTSRSGNPYLKIEGYVFGTTPDNFQPGKWRYWIKDGSEFLGNSGRYDSIREAKLALFDELARLLDW